MLQEEIQNKLKDIVNSRSYDLEDLILWGKIPTPGEYYITGTQQGNLHGELGWDKYIGYVVQVRRKAGCYGSNLILMRLDCGELMRHENQSYHKLSESGLKKYKELCPDSPNPNDEDYSKLFTLSGKFPRKGKILEPEPDVNQSEEVGPMATITTCHSDGTKTVEAV